MAVTVTEKIESRSHSAEGSELTYRILGTSDATVALSNLASTAPSTFDGQIRGTCRVKETERSDLWIGTVPYKPAGKAPPPVPETGATHHFDLSTAGGTQHITNSLETISSYAPDGETAPDFDQLIGVTDEGVEGVDIGIGAFEFSQKHYVADANFTSAYILKLFQQRYTTNSAAWTAYFRDASIEFPIGSVLYKGAEINERADDVEVILRFSAIENQTGLEIGDIDSIAKKGHEYLWVFYRTVEDGVAKKLVKRPAAVYVERVYDASAFADLAPPS